MAKEKEKPLTREDVLKLIEEHGGRAKGLDLSGKVFEEGIDLSELDLSGIKLQGASLFKANLQRADFVNANFQGTILPDANLQGSNLAGINLQDAALDGVNLQGANLADANLRRADLMVANLQGARLLQADFRGATVWDANFKGAMLEEVKWDPKYIVGDEPKFERGMTKDTRRELLDKAESVYRNLKRCHAEQGLYDIAGKFFYREMEARRKQLRCWPNPLPKIRQTLYWLVYGYGEMPWRVFAWAGVVIFGLATAYHLWGSFSSSSFWDTLYYSAASFTALGYGRWAPQPTGWAKGMGAAEAFIGVFMMALLLVTFVRKMTR